MAAVRLDVPVLAQEKSNCCWHTSAMMVWLYSQGRTGREGPMNTPSAIYARADTKGITPQEFITLARTVGLKDLPNKNLHSANDLAKYLGDSGPVWSAGHWFGFGHVIVLTGVDCGTVYFNDPDGGVKKTNTLKWFNEKLANQLIGCLMTKDPDRY